MLEQKIMSDIEDRQGVMIGIKTFCSRNQLNVKDEKLFLTHSISMIYAIWEGFVQTSFQAYISELNKLNLPIDSICDEVLVYHMDTSFPQFREYPGKLKRKVAFFNQLNTFYEAKFIEITRTVNTESNVGLSVLNRMLAAFNLEKIPDYLTDSALNQRNETPYSIQTELDTFLLKSRNAVVHGTDAIILERKDVQRATKLVEILMDLVSKRILDGFKNKSYLRRVP
jgi:hypothetical protein